MKRFSGFSNRVNKIKGKSESILHTLQNNRYDIVYIDGNHRSLNVLMDAMFSWRYLKTGGMLIFDDYEWQPQKRPEETPKMAIDIFLKNPQSQITLLHKGYQVIVQKTC